LEVTSSVMSWISSLSWNQSYTDEEFAIQKKNSFDTKSLLKILILGVNI